MAKGLFTIGHNLRWLCCSVFVPHRPSSPLRDVPKEILEGISVNGLKEEIRVELRLLKPVGLGEIKEIAQKDRGEESVASSRGYGIEGFETTISWGIMD